MRYFVSDREPLAAKRIGGALDSPPKTFGGRLVVQRERRAANADFIWLNTPSKAHKAACASVASYNPRRRRAAGPRAQRPVLRSSGALRRSGAVVAEFFASVKGLRAFIEQEDLRGAWVVKDATANLEWVCGSHHARKIYLR